MSIKDTSQDSDTGFSLLPVDLPKPKIVSNVPKEYVLTTEERIRLSCYEHQDILAWKRGWITPATLSITLLASILATSQHNPLLGLSPETWDAFFLILLVLSCIWLLVALNHLKKAWGEDDINSFVKSIIIRK